MPKPTYHIIVCTNARPPGHPKPSCGAAGSNNILMALNVGLLERGHQPGEVLVTASSCLGPCEQGPTLVIYPDGIWYAQVKDEHVGAILDEHIGKGKPVESLKPDSVWG